MHDILVFIDECRFLRNVYQAGSFKDKSGKRNIYGHLTIDSVNLYDLDTYGSAHCWLANDVFSIKKKRDWDPFFRLYAYCVREKQGIFLNSSLLKIVPITRQQK